MLVEQLFEQLTPFNEVIFDLDNTIYSQQYFDRGAFEDITTALKEECSLPITGFADYLLYLKEIKGNKYKRLFNDALAKYQLPNYLLPVMLASYTAHDGRYINQADSLVPLIKTRLKNKKIFVVTNGPVQVQITKLKRLGLHDWVTYVICSSKKPEQLKPNRYAFDKITKQHPCSKLIMVGDDDTTDGLFAHKVNIPFIHFDIRHSDK